MMNLLPVSKSFPAGSGVKNPPANAGDSGSIPRFGKIPWRRQRQPAPRFLPGESPWTEEPGGATVHRVAKSQTRLKRLTTHVIDKTAAFGKT